MSTTAAMDAQPGPRRRKVAPQPPSTEPRIELERVNCLLCGGDRHDTVVVAPDPATGIGGTFCVVRCRQCQLAFTNPRPTIESIAAFYPTDYGPYVGRTGSDCRRRRSRLERAVLRSHFGYPPQPPGPGTASLSWLGRLAIRRSRQRQWWIPYREPGRLLDFGCGAGRFLGTMRAYGWSAEGLDVSPAVARQVEESTGIRVHVGTLPHPDLKPNSFDVITMWHALEHVHRPRAVVRAARSLLRRGGLLVVAVPNFASWSFRTFRENWYGLELPRHLVHFTPRTLVDLMNREGFGVLSLKHIARDGCLRKSARRAAKDAGTPWWGKACRWKSWGYPVAQWTERTQQADVIRLIAENQ